MKLHVSTEPADISEHKCLVLGIFADEKPPRGICGYIDWRLNGYISKEIKQGHIAGKFAEKVIIPSPPRINTGLLMLCGMGNASKINADQVYKYAYQLITSVDKLLIDDFSVELPGASRVTFPVGEAAEAMARGFFDYLSREATKPNKITACLLTSPEHAKDAAAGIKNFKAKTKE